MFTEREWRELYRLHGMLPWSSWGGRRAHILERKLVEEAGKPEIIVQKGGGTCRYKKVKKLAPRSGRN